jgi:hypothetical protein
MKFTSRLLITSVDELWERIVATFDAIRNRPGQLERVREFMTSQRTCCGKWSALWTSYVILKRVPAHACKSISRNLFTFRPMLIGTFLRKWGWGIHRKRLWHRFWDTRCIINGVHVSFGSILYCVCFNLCKVWVCVCVGVLVICVLLFTVFCVVCTVCFGMVSFICIYSYFFYLY